MNKWRQSIDKLTNAHIDKSEILLIASQASNILSSWVTIFRGMHFGGNDAAECWRLWLKGASQNDMQNDAVIYVCEGLKSVHRAMWCVMCQSCNTRKRYLSNTPYHSHNLLTSLWRNCHLFYSLFLIEECTVVTHRLGHHFSWFSPHWVTF